MEIGNMIITEKERFELEKFMANNMFGKHYDFDLQIIADIYYKVAEVKQTNVKEKQK